MRITEAQYKHYLKNHPTLKAEAPAASPPAPGKSMNATEARYARDQLEPGRLAGLIREYRFQVEGLWLADGLFYYPDFRVITTDWRVVFHEVKGGFVREDAWIKFKMAVKEHPYPFVLAQWKDGRWTTKLYVREER